MIGGNLTVKLQVGITTKNEIGESVKSWHDAIELIGWLDLSGGDSKYTTYNAKVQESTHIFLCDYKQIPDTLLVEGEVVKVLSENARLVTNSKRYDVLLIDNPMEMNRQLEIYLKYTGGQ